MKTNNVYYHLAKTPSKPINKIHAYKIVENTFFVSNELTNSQTIAKIPNYSILFHICEHNTPLDKHVIMGKKHSEIVIKIGGGEQLIYLKNYLKALSSPRIYISSIINFYQTYLKSIQLLVNNQIVHNCIQFDALMVDTKSNRPIIGDFAVSLNILKASSLDYIRPFFIQYDPEYTAWPIELHMLSFLLTNKLPSLSLTNIQNIIHDTSRANTVLQTFGKTIVSAYEADALEYFSKYANKSLNYIVTDIFYYYDTWDNYALSIVFLKILIGLHKSLGTSKQNKFIILFMKLLVSNINFHPQKRISIGDTTNKFEGIMDAIDANVWTDLNKHLFSTT
jgi:hypothetical protein